MEETKSLCNSSIQPNISSGLEGIKGRSSSYTDNSALENTTMVSTSPSLVLRKLIVLPTVNNLLTSAYDLKQKHPTEKTLRRLVA